MPSPGPGTAASVLSHRLEPLRPSVALSGGEPPLLHAWSLPRVSRQPPQSASGAEPELGPSPDLQASAPVLSWMLSCLCVLISEVTVQVLAWGGGASAVRVCHTDFCKLRGNVNQPKTPFTEDVSNTNCSTVGGN